MFNEYLKKTNPKAVEYFESLFNYYFKGEKNIPNSIVLWGSDPLAQYMFALDIARNINCQKEGRLDCDCHSCCWIRKNEHPEIRTVSKINSKASGDETKNISVRQIKELLEQLNVKSEDYRVVIFCDADYEKLTAEQISHIADFGELQNVILKNGEKYWIPKPLSQKVFQEESANALLKTLEEPPKNLTFIFLTSSPNDLISTIISRSQMFYIQNTYQKEYDFSFVKEILKDFPNTKKADFYDFTEKSLEYVKDKDMPVYDYLELIQAYLTELISLNYDNSELKNKILTAVNEVITAKKYVLASVKAEYVLDDFWVNIS